MVGFKHIPQTVIGKQADDLLKKLSKESSTQKDKGLAPLPDKFTVDWKR